MNKSYSNQYANKCMSTIGTSKSCLYIIRLITKFWKGAT